MSAANVDALITDNPPDTLETDVLIIGSGMGGSTLAWALRHAGVDVLVAERGTFLAQEPENSQPQEMYVKGRYRNAEPWYDGSNGQPFKPGVYYWVGGNTKFYGACLPRFRRSDFTAVQTHDGMSPAWPFSYEDLEPFYAQIENLFEVHGRLGLDPTEPEHSTPYPYPALDHEPEIQRFAESLRRQGLHPFQMSNCMNLRTQRDRELCTTCDGCPCETGRKADAQNHALEPALASGRIRLITNTRVIRLETSVDGSTVTTAHATFRGRNIRINAKQIVAAGGAVNSAVLLLRSATNQHPRGLANSSDLLGRNYMVHNSTFFVAINPLRKNPTAWQKTLGLNDWYEAGPTTTYPLGNLQMLGKLQGAMIKAARPWAPLPVLDFMMKRSLDIYLTTEDLPVHSNRVRLVDDRIFVDWRPNNIVPHQELVKRVTKAVRKAGYPLIFTERMGISTNSHQCGTAVAGTDPGSSVLDPTCRSHDVKNLWVVDSSFFPSSAALNPALTIAANAARVAPHIVAAVE